MSQRLALIQLHNLLLPADEQEVLQSALARLELSRTLPSPPSGPVPPGRPDQDQRVRTALDELVGSSDEPELLPESDAVTPIEVLHLLIRLSSRVDLTAFLDGNESPVGALAGRLLRHDLQSDPDRVSGVLRAINRLEDKRGVLRIRGLDEHLRLEETVGPTGPTAEPDDVQTVGDLLDPDGVLGLLDAVTVHPLVDVEARLYKAIVEGRAEYPVHLRTTIRFPHPTQDMIDRFPRILEPSDWPKYHSFWKKMIRVPGGGTVVLADESVRNALKQSTNLEKNISTSFRSWAPIGTYQEKVGFDPDDDLFPGTILFFARSDFSRDDGFARSLLSYSLVGDSSRLGVDDGCIELALSPLRADVITTKSLYVTGVGNGTEVGGTLAYFAANSGWGAQTLALVANAVLK